MRTDDLIQKTPFITDQDLAKQLGQVLDSKLVRLLIGLEEHSRIIRIPTAIINTIRSELALEGHEITEQEATNYNIHVKTIENNPQNYQTLLLFFDNFGETKLDHYSQNTLEKLLGTPATAEITKLHKKYSIENYFKNHETIPAEIVNRLITKDRQKLKTLLKNGTIIAFTREQLEHAIHKAKQNRESYDTLFYKEHSGKGRKAFEAFYMHQENIQKHPWMKHLLTMEEHEAPTRESKRIIKNKLKIAKSGPFF